MREVTRRNKSNRKSPISDEEIIELREKGWSYYLMAKHFAESGRKITPSALQQRCARIYEIIGTDIPKTKRTINTKECELKVKDSTIFKLKEKGYSYKKIQEYYNIRGINISLHKIMERCRAMYKKKGLGRAKKGVSKSARQYDLDAIFILRQSKWSYERIAKFIGNQTNTEISYMTIRKLCKKMYAEKGLKEPKLFRGLKTGVYTKVSDHEITQLKMQGYTYNKMVKYFKNEGKNISRNNVALRARSMFGILVGGKRSAVDIRTANENVMKNALMNLKQTKGATDEQLQVLASVYGMNYIPEAEKINPYKVSECDINREDI